MFYFVQLKKYKRFKKRLNNKKNFFCLQEKEESQDWFDQFTYNEIEEMLDVAERVIRAGISRNDIISFTGKCCENLDICRMNPKNYIRC